MVMNVRSDTGTIKKKYLEATGTNEHTGTIYDLAKALPGTSYNTYVHVL